MQVRTSTDSVGDRQIADLQTDRFAKCSEGIPEMDPFWIITVTAKCRQIGLLHLTEEDVYGFRQREQYDIKGRAILKFATQFNQA